MKLPPADLVRNFTLGFALGAGVVAWQIAPAMAQPAPSSAPVVAATR